MMRYETLIVGLGQIGMGYDLELDRSRYVYSHARAFGLHPGFALTAAVDPDPARRKTFEDAYERPAYPDVEAALHAHQPQVVVIAVPTSVHGSTLRQVLTLSHPRALLCEKPLSDDIDEARRMIDACTTKDVALFVNYMRRSDPAVIEVKRRIAVREIGTPIKGVAWYSKGLKHNGSHLLNLLQYWLGPVTAFQVVNAGSQRTDRDGEPDVHVTFEQGTMTLLATGQDSLSHHEIVMLATNGRLRYEAGGKRVAWEPIRSHPDFAGYTALDDSAEPIASGMDRYQWHVADQLSAALEGRSFQLCTADDARQTLEAVQTILGHT